MIDITILASGSNGNCYYITDGSFPLLIECGIAYKEIQKGINFKTSSVAGCLITHEHSDHSKSVNDIIKAGIDCYMTQGTKESLGTSGHRVHVITSKQQFNIGEWIILPFDTQHDAIEPVGFLLANKAGDKILYATDTCYIKYRFSHLTHIMIECNYSLDILKNNMKCGLVPLDLESRILRSHLSLENLKTFLKANDLSECRKIILLHLSDINSSKDKMVKEIQQLTGIGTIVAEPNSKVTADFY